MTDRQIRYMYINLMSHCIVKVDKHNCFKFCFFLLGLFLYQLWMGTHINCPSKVRTGRGSSLSLKDWITQHPLQLGDAVTKRFGNDLPFLFKVLSVNKSLSVQAHPNKVGLWKKDDTVNVVYMACTIFGGKCFYSRLAWI